ncbi:YjbQ family protein [Enterococcus sp. BWB1-3]|uniref:YjbQ family protein n=1 Tax=Enterococcus sp. BWB1-3 TaxID=2787713 RepID=UPI0019238AB4|nr:YjbQ family protein [Enterococcus sp. BWB1-3]MBL1229093.1 YjbQ family protein [Enterococcus sp. BWB1-3]
MKIAEKELILRSNGRRVTYHNITEEIKKFLDENGVKNGICTVQSQHTTCSVIFEEFVHDLDYNGDEFLQADLNHVLDRIVPRELSENMNYRYPGQKHLDFLLSLNHKDHPSDSAVLLNGDAHIRASIFGASETLVVKEEKLMTGVVGSVYFIDFDQNRVRDRICHLHFIGE